MDKILTKNVFIGVLIIIIAILYFLWSASSNNYAEQKTLNTTMNAQLDTWKDKDDLNRAKIAVIETRNTKDFTRAATTDSIIMELQDKVEEFSKQLKKQGSVTILKTITSIDTSFQSQVTQKDTITKDGVNYVFPEYKSSFDLDGWVIGTTIANKDSTAIDFEIKNDYSLVIGLEKNGWFKKSTPFADVKNLNPYTKTEALRTYQVTLPKPPKIKLGGYVGYGGTVYESKVVVGPQAGAGIIINF